MHEEVAEAIPPTPRVKGGGGRSGATPRRRQAQGNAHQERKEKVRREKVFLIADYPDMI